MPKGVEHEVEDSKSYCKICRVPLAVMPKGVEHHKDGIFTLEDPKFPWP